MMNAAPFPLVFFGSVLGAASPNDQVRIAGFIAFGVGLFLTGLFMGLGRYRGPTAPRT